MLALCYLYSNPQMSKAGLTQDPRLLGQGKLYSAEFLPEAGDLNTLCGSPIKYSYLANLS